MIGVELSIDGAPFVSEAMRRGLLINCTHDFALRLLPPLHHHPRAGARISQAL